MSQFDSIRFQPSRPLLKEISADRLNAILSEIKKNRPRGERGITVRQSGDATYIGLASSARGTTTTTTHPFQISSTQDPDNEGQYLVTVLPGTLNNLLPDNLLDNGALQTFPANASSLSYIVLTGTSDGKQFNSCLIESVAQPPEAQTPVAFGLPETISFLLGVVYGSTVYQVATDNIEVTGKEQYVASKSSALEPGELPYTIYYVWAAP